jgi:hypothetical protein
MAAIWCCLLGWVALVLLFFTLSSGKRKLYIFPALPGLVLAMAPLLPWLLRWFAGRPWVRRSSSFWRCSGSAPGLPVKLHRAAARRWQRPPTADGGGRPEPGGRAGPCRLARRSLAVCYRQPLVHFGLDTPNQVVMAAEWLRSHPQDVAMISAR